MTSSGDETPPIGTGPRLVSPAEFAAVLSVSEDDVRQWIAEGKLSSEPGPDGEPWLRLIDEAHEEEGGASTSFVTFSTDDLSYEELDSRRRERAPEGPTYDGPVDVIAGIAERMTENASERDL